MRRIRAFEDWEGYDAEEKAHVLLMNGRKNKIADNIEELFKTVFNKRFGNNNIQCLRDDSSYWKSILYFYKSPTPIKHTFPKSILSFEITHSSDSDTIYIYLKDGTEFFGFFDNILDQTVGNTSTDWFPSGSLYYWIPFNISGRERAFNKMNDGDAKVNRINYQEYKTYLAKETGKPFDL